MEPMRDPVHRDGEKSGIGQYNLIHTLRGGIPFVNGLRVLKEYGVKLWKVRSVPIDDGEDLSLLGGDGLAKPRKARLDTRHKGTNLRALQLFSARVLRKEGSERGVYELRDRRGIG